MLVNCFLTISLFHKTDSEQEQVTPKAHQSHLPDFKTNRILDSISHSTGCDDNLGNGFMAETI